jgi:hypothetical protein
LGYDHVAFAKLSGLIIRNKAFSFAADLDVESRFWPNFHSNLVVA